MGARHAINYLEKTPRAQLVAVCDPSPSALAWANTRLAPSGVKVYASFDEMLAQPGIEAVIVSGITTEHAPQSIAAIKAGKHVLCEKPLSTDLDISMGVVEVAKQSPKLKVMTGFSRRFDQSYRNAQKKLIVGILEDLWFSDHRLVISILKGITLSITVKSLEVSSWMRVYTILILRCGFLVRIVL